MHRLLAVLLATLSWAGVPENSLTLVEGDSGVQTDRPFSISRVFAEGEIPDYPQPVVDGTPETTWQSDVKTRWRDGSVTRTITDASNESPITITSVGHGFETGEFVTIASVGGNTAANGYWRVIRISRDEFSLTGSTGNGAYTSGGTTTGPDLGSVQHAIVSFTESFTADESKTLTFQNSANPCSNGNQAACDAAGLDEAEMLAFNSSAWGASIECETPDGNDTTRSASARTIIDDGNFEYWLRGPVVTEVIASDESSSRTYDFGWECLTNCSGDYSSSTWADETTEKPLHPRFILTFYTGWSGVKVDYILESPWNTHLADQYYSYTLKSAVGLGTTEFGPSDDTLHTDRSRWHAIYWDGSEPGSIEIDHNAEYMVYSKVLPMYDLSKSVTEADLASEISAQAGYSWGVLTGNGGYNRTFAATGGRPELGYLPRWDVRYLLSGFDSGLEPYILSSADVAGYIPIHFRDSHTTENHYMIDLDRDGNSASDADDSASGTAFGHVVSTDADYNHHMVAGGTYTCAGTCGGTLGWAPDLAHQSAFAFMAYLTTGNYYYLEEMWFWAAWDLIYGNAGTSQPYHRHGSWGIITISLQARGVGWALRNVAHATFLSPDGTPEKELFRNKFENTIGAFEGYHQTIGGAHFRKLTDATDADPCDGYSASSYDPSLSTPYCFGYKTFLSVDSTGTNSLPYPHPDDDAFESGWTAGYTLSSTVQDHYFALGPVRANELGFPTEDFARVVSKVHLNMLGRADDFNPMCYGDGYRRPRTDDSEVWWTNWHDFYYAYPESGYRDLEAWNSNYDVQNGFAISSVAISSLYTQFADGPARGWDLWDWIHNEENMANSTTYETGVGSESYDYKWALIPRREPTRVKVVEPGDTFFILRYVAPTTTACTVIVDDSSDYGSPVYSASDGLSTREREVAATGLTAETPYYWRVFCADDPYNSGNTDSDGTLSTLAALSGTADLNVWVGQGQSTTYLDYDQDGAAPWGNTTSESCTTGCTLAAAGISKGRWYYRIRHADGAVGAVHQAIVQ